MRKPIDKRDLKTRPTLKSTSQCTMTAYWHHRADERLGNPIQGNQEPSVVKDDAGRPPGELGLCKFAECETFPFTVLTLLVG